MIGLNAIGLPYRVISYLWLIAVEYWKNSVFSLYRSKKIQVLPPSLKDLEKMYETKRTQQFLKTFESSDTDFSQNIEPVFYEEKELSLRLIDEDNDLEKTWKSRILMEYTPRGNILMFYDPFKRAFSYYSDQASIPYQLVNAVAMKYVVTFMCRDFFIDDGVVPKDRISRFTQRDDAAKPSGQISKGKSPFIKLRSANTTTNAQEKVTNRFLHLGKMSNYYVLQKPKVKNGNNGFATSLFPSKKLSYEEYKKQKLLQ
jgi:hypothetical protein